MKVSGTTCTSPADARARASCWRHPWVSCLRALLPPSSGESNLHLEQCSSPDPRDKHCPTETRLEPRKSGFAYRMKWRGVLKWKGGFGERTLLKQDSWRKEICSVERAHLLFNRLCPRQGCCRPHPRKHHLPPTALPCYKHPSSISVLCLARARGSPAWVAAAGEKAAACHCSHFKEKANGCWKMQGERQEKDYQLARNTSEPLKHCTGIISMPSSELEQSASLAHRNIAYRGWGTTRF